ncbi:hypothetical protein [Micromonospora ureilytica]|uniref:hypothetical protein n=1 Tax=Micromonospora ureilytica TaxID=709868 RepID=UPI00403A672B
MTSGSAAHLDATLPLVSTERMAATISALASAEFTGRRVGTAGGTAARAWLVAHLANLGAAVDTDDFPVRNVPELYQAPAVVWGEGDTSTRLTCGREVAVHCASADTSEVRRGSLGVAGSGDPAGRWLVVPAGGNPLDAARDVSGAAGLLVSRAVDADGWQYTVLAGPDPAFRSPPGRSHPTTAATPRRASRRWASAPAWPATTVPPTPRTASTRTP